MALLRIQLTGHITDSGKLDIDLPEGLPPGEVQVTIEVSAEEDAAWTDEELQEMLRVTPKTGAEIVTEIEAGLIGEGWSEVTNSGEEWVEEQRQKHLGKFPKW